MHSEYKMKWKHSAIWTIVLVLHLVAQSSSTTCDDQYSEIIRSGANDVIVVLQKDGKTLLSTPFQVQVGKFSNFMTFWQSREGKEVQIYINGMKGPRSLYVTDSGMACFKEPGNNTWTSDEWHQVPLYSGRNDGFFHVPELGIDIPFNVYVYSQGQRLVISDIDGTITESDVKGQVYSLIGSSAHHKYVIPLMAAIKKRGYEVIYLTARPLAQDDETRAYLFGTLGRMGLPMGPLFLSPKTLGAALIDSTVGSPRYTKAKTIMGIVGLFDKGSNMVWGAYGNKHHDKEAYVDAGIQKRRIYIVNPEGVIIRGDGKGKPSSYKKQLTRISRLYPKYKINTEIVVTNN